MVQLQTEAIRVKEAQKVLLRSGEVLEQNHLDLDTTSRPSHENVALPNLSRYTVYSGMRYARVHVVERYACVEPLDLRKQRK